MKIKQNSCVVGKFNAILGVLAIYDILHAFLSSVVAKLCDFKTVRFLAHPVFRHTMDNYTVSHNYRTPNFKRHNLVNIRFIYTKISDNSRRNAESAYLETICLLTKYSLPTAV